MKPSDPTTPPPLLEQLGALGSLLIHDMANQVCIISGNATFAQMMREDPEQVDRAVGAIFRAGEHMSKILSQCADLRRRVAAGVPPGDGAEALAGVRAIFRDRPEWTLEVQAGMEGELYVPTAWVVFAVSQTLTEVQGSGGKVRVRRIRPEEDTAFLPGGTYWELRFEWISDKAFSMDEVRKRYKDFGLLAAFELVRQCGGKLEGFTPAPGRQEALLCVPYVHDLGKGQSAGT